MMKPDVVVWNGDGAPETIRQAFVHKIRPGASIVVIYPFPGSDSWLEQWVLAIAPMRLIERSAVGTAIALLFDEAGDGSVKEETPLNVGTGEKPW